MLLALNFEMHHVAIAGNARDGAGESAPRRSERQDYEADSANQIDNDRPVGNSPKNRFLSNKSTKAKFFTILRQQVYETDCL
jgi:hypothetical protein